MSLSIPQNVLDFVNNHNYDIRISGYGRWIDQKCTPDVLSFIADCVVVFLEEHPNRSSFLIKDIWYSKYAIENAMGSFRKPDPKDANAQNEYDKFFGQPLLLLGYSGVLKLRKQGSCNCFEVVDFDMLRYIAMRDKNAIDFMYAYITKVVKDSGIYYLFERFFIEQDDDAYNKLKDGFEEFLHTYTPIRKHLECGRIFTKVINILAYGNKKFGTKGGHISKEKIELSDLMYNGDNFRDIYTNKPKGMTRAEYQQLLHNQTTTDEEYSSSFSEYQVSRAKRYVRQYNARYNDGLSELRDGYDMSEASYIHHIFPKSQFPEIAHYLENLIALTPNQHWNQAHPHGNTQRIDREVQQLLIVCKCETIRIDYVEKRGVYDFEKFQLVLDTGLDTDIFEEIDYLDFDTIIKQVNKIYTELE